MKSNKFSERKWYPYAWIVFGAVVLYVVLTNISTVWATVVAFCGHFSAVALGCVLAYLINPLARLYQRKLFGKSRKADSGWTVSVALAVISVLLLVIFLLGTLVPQLIKSIQMFMGNLDGYMISLQTLEEKWGLSRYVDLDSIVDSSKNIMDMISSFLTNHLDKIVDVSAVAGKTLFNGGIAFILSIYLLSEKDPLKSGTIRLMKALLKEDKYAKTIVFLTRCDTILIRYIVFSLLDAAIIGVANAVFMSIMGMQYIGLVSVVVALTNLIPTFGPVIGGVIGGFVLLMVEPWHALAFLVFTLLLQLCDGYVIKPKLFGNSLGVSGLLILIWIIVGGSMFSVIGILLAIPFAAILDFVYRDYFLPMLEGRKVSDVDDMKPEERDN